ncbi:N-acetyl-gamma-glutamyl-phosphate reductase [Prochlorococcus sp. MIT 1307]|uniref:N-acetyl-gamma-glutamyl-phosphate reductase n=1 Tax=Prochlorococcus sp. MIT 1307 TaxID=3096219 RepID=UPI002A76025F|nr:N-acetyl-gamma-glutamyl-phosphate reductase [Prochlorococcus sp. MIT 1307]
MDGSNSRVAIVGASGYGGLQSIRLLNDHPYFNVTYLAGDKSAGRRWNELCPFLPLENNPSIEKADPEKISKNADFAILSLPNGLASQIVPELLERNVRVLDLSADYRYNSLEQWKQIYIKESKLYNRRDHDLCNEAIYGLSEWNTNQISKARIVSSPGCFPTASLLPLLPFLKQGLIYNDGLIIDSKTGTSGGGRSPKEALLLSEASEAISPYGVIGHRHTSEIEEQATLVAGQEIQLQFTPHLVPMVRGILSTVYGRLRDPGLTADDCLTVLETVYRDQPNIGIMQVGTYPSTKWVRQTNRALLSVQVDSRTGQLVLISVIDNLVKGQAGQGIQNLNIMAGLPQETGLPLKPFYP